MAALKDLAPQSAAASGRPHRHARRILIVALLVLAAALAALAVGIHAYASVYYHATPEASEALVSTDTTTVSQLDDGDVTFVPADPYDAKAALVFYPGGKVEATAYAPLLARLSDEGIACVLVRMPENLAVLAPNRANRGRTELATALSRSNQSSAKADAAADIPWMVGGHSLGGAMAAQFASGHANDYQGLVLLAAYSASDLTDTDLHILLCSGSNDGVMNRSSYEKDRANLPEKNVTEIVIDGGIHSYFGCYGHQEGDGSPTITNDDQLDQSAEAIARFAQGLSPRGTGPQDP